MKVWHPDVCTRNDAYERFVEILEAYELLNDPQQRKQYDEMRKKSEAETIRDVEEKQTSLFGCLIICFLTLISLSFVAFIAYKVYLALHGGGNISTPS